MARVSLSTAEERQLRKAHTTETTDSLPSLHSVFARGALSSFLLLLPNRQCLLLLFLIEMAERLQHDVDVNDLAPGADQMAGERTGQFAADSQSIQALHRQYRRTRPARNIYTCSYL